MIFLLSVMKIVQLFVVLILLIMKPIRNSWILTNADAYGVAIHNLKVVGFVGHVKGDFRIACDKSNQGRGFAQFMYLAFLNEFPFVTIQVKKDNYRSLAFFKKLGLESQMDASTDVGKGTVSLCRIRS